MNLTILLVGSLNENDRYIVVVVAGLGLEPVCMQCRLSELSRSKDVNGGKYYISAEGELFVSHFAND